MTLEMVLVGFGVLLAIVSVMVILTRFRKPARKTLAQLLIFDLFLLVPFLIALLSPAVTDKTNTFWIVLEAFFLLGMNVFLIIRLRKTETGRQKLTGISVSSLLHRYRWEIAIVVITFLSRILFVDTAQKWDSSEYYYTIMKAGERYTFTPASFIKTFGLLDHPSHGMAYWATIGEFITPMDIRGTLMVSLILTCAASVCIFRMFRFYWAKLQNGSAFLGTLLCLSLPIFWAGYCCVMADYYLAIFVVFLMYEDYRKNNILLFFWSVMAAFTKETGMIIVFMYYVVKVLNLLMTCKKPILQRALHVIRDRSIAAGVLTGMVIISYFLYRKGVSNWSQSVYYSEPIQWSGSGDLLYNTFGLQADNILTRIKEYLIVNFAWILTGISAICLIIRGFRKQRYAQINALSVVQIVVVMAVHAVFMCLFITAASIRYNVIFTLFLAILTYILLADVVKVKLRAVVTSTVCCLMAVQSFISIDVVTNSMFRLIDAGKSNMLLVAQERNINAGGDYHITNLQYRAMHENFEKMFKDIALTEYDTIVIAGADYVECAKNLTISELCGRRSDIRWDDDNQQYKNSISPDDVVINTFSTNTLFGRRPFPANDASNQFETAWECLEKIRGRTFTFFSPIFQSNDQNEIIEQLERIFYCDSIQSVDTCGITLSYCELFVKPESEWLIDMDTKRLARSGLEEATQRYYRNMRNFAVVEGDALHDTVQFGDRIAMTIACYDENGAFINFGLSPRGVINTQYSIGIGETLSVFDDIVLGMAIGETRTGSITLPDEYNNHPELSGRTITVTVTVKALINQLSVITDAMIQENLDFPSVQTYQEFLKDKYTVLYGETE